jgi:ParB family transcriptional regulator, chromosome partitioning protein
MTDPNLTLEQVDPATLLVDGNVRSDAALDKAFIGSIRDLGVLVPIVAVRTTSGELRVRYGQRRTLAAVQAARTTVPVIVAGEDDADDAARIVSQWHENEHRAGLTTSDKVAAVEQLSLLGLSAAQIVRQTRSRKTDVDQALAAAGSALAKGATERYDFLTLDQAAAVAEFEAQPDTVKALIAGAKSSDGDFAHCLQRARDDREEAAKRQALLDELTAAGVTVIDRPAYNDRTARVLHEMATEDGKELTAKQHAACPGHAAYLHADWSGRIQAVYVCTKWQDVGHRDLYGNARGSTPAPMDDDAKEERRRVLANNKAWRSAATVRRQFLSTLLARKTAPKGSATYIAVEIGTGIHELRRGMERGHQTAAELLGLDRSKDRHAIAAAAAAATDGRAQVIALAVVLGDIEESTDVHTWRNPSDTVRRYFAFLAANGYTLSDVEQLAGGVKKPRKPRSTRNADAA